jgi:hypothetical protein
VIYFFSLDCFDDNKDRNEEKKEEEEDEQNKIQVRMNNEIVGSKSGRIMR